VTPKILGIVNPRTQAVGEQDVYDIQVFGSSDKKNLSGCRRIMPNEICMNVGISRVPVQFSQIRPTVERKLYFANLT
jgi:hypothetical protein